MEMDCSRGRLQLTVAKKKRAKAIYGNLEKQYNKRTTGNEELYEVNETH